MTSDEGSQILSCLQCLSFSFASPMQRSLWILSWSLVDSITSAHYTPSPCLPQAQHLSVTPAPSNTPPDSCFCCHLHPYMTPPLLPVTPFSRSEYKHLWECPQQHSATQAVVYLCPASPVCSHTFVTLNCLKWTPSAASGTPAAHQHIWHTAQGTPHGVRLGSGSGDTSWCQTGSWVRGHPKVWLGAGLEDTQRCQTGSWHAEVTQVLCWSVVLWCTLSYMDFSAKSGNLPWPVCAAGEGLTCPQGSVSTVAADI